jgi:hypothetical protein
MPRRLLAALAATAAVTVVTGTVLFADAAPASAHGVGGVQPTSYETRLLDVSPDVEGVHVAVIDLGARLEVRNDTDTEVLVRGYDGEPYLRVGPEGVFENQHSPTWWVNRDRYGAVDPEPPDVDADAPPEWVRAGSGSTARFHWHLAHWMSPNRPPIVSDEPDRVHELSEWELRLEHDGESIVARGDLRWVPGPSSLPYALAGVIALAAVVALGRTRHWRVALVAGLVVLIAAESVHLVGLWTASTDSLGRRLLANLYSIVGIAFGAAAVARLVGRRDPYDGTPLALVAGLVLAVAGGLADLATLTSSSLPTDVPENLARYLVTITLGAGTGVVVTAATHLRRPVVEAAPGAVR